MSDRKEVEVPQNGQVTFYCIEYGRDMAVLLDPHFMTVVPTIKPCAVPQVAVNTTAGTGAEMTGFAMVTDWESHWKYVIIALNIIPVQGILDPALLRTMPERTAAQTGMDCFVHGMGGFVSRVGNQLAKEDSFEVYMSMM